MKAADLREAHAVLQALRPEARKEAETLAVRLRTTGLPATLRWLRSKAPGRPGHQQILELLERRFGGLERADTPSLLAAYRDALALAEALHAATRDKTAGGS